MTVTSRTGGQESADCLGSAGGCACVSRRAVLRSVALTGGSIAAAALVSGCGSSTGSSASSSSPNATSAPTSAATSAATSRGGAGSGKVLGPVSDVPVGGGAIFPAAQVVVTQPTSGTFMAFSSSCTHAGCPVTEVVDKEIVCPCHGSRFSIEDGAPVVGPATTPLAPAQVSVDGDQLVLG